MAITVKHKFVSAIPDAGDPTIVQPSNWNDTHELTGLGTMAEQNANSVAITGGSISGVTVSGYVPTTTTITAGTGLTGGGDLSANRTLAIANTAVVAGNYGTDARSMTLAINAQGQITSAIDQPIAIANTQVSGLGTASTKDAGVANGVATLDAGGKVPQSQIPLMGDLNYQGTWNASTNTPALTSSVGTKGYYYVVDVAGTTNLNGITDWQIGDWAIFNGTVWQKVDNTDAVTSVNGQVGTVVLTAADVGAQPAGTYVTSVSATSPVTSTGGTTPTIAMPAANSTTNGYLTSTDWNTFNTISTGGVVGPASATDNAIARFDSTTGKLIQNSVVTVSDAGVVDGVTHMNNVDYIDFDTTYATTLGAGQLGWNGNDTLGLGMIGGNVIQHIGEDVFFYVKASATITKGQLCMFTGAVGSSGVLTAAPSTAIPFAEAIIGVAAENIANNAFGLVQSVGTLRGVDTSAFLDGDILYYNSAVTGGFTKTFPTSGPIVIAAAVAKAGSGGSGVLTIRVSFQTRVTAGTAMSVTQGNDVVTVNNTGVTSAVAGTGISVSGATGAVTVTNTAPDQIVSITGAGTTTVTGTYPNFTVSSDDQFDGTVTSVSGTGTVNGITLSGTVTSSGNLTLGGTLSGVSLSTQVTGTLPIANGGTGETTRQAAMDALAGAVTSGQYLRGNGTDVVMSAIQAADVPTLNQNTTGTAANVTGVVAVANGGTGLTSLTANRVPYGAGTSALGNEADFTYDPSLNTLTAPQVNASNGIVVNSNTVSANYTIPSGSSAMSAGPMTVSSGVVVTVSSGSRWVVL
jgi:hypothetical protein